MGSITEQVCLKDIEKIFANGFGKGNHEIKEDFGKLSEKQISVLRRYKAYYEAKPSTRGGTIKVKSLWNAMMILRKFGLFLKKPFEEATKEDLINFVIKRLKGKAEATKSNWIILLGSFYKWLLPNKMMVCSDRYGKQIYISELFNDEMLKYRRPKPTRKPSDLLTEEEIKRMLECALDYRGKCLIMLTFGEAGLRAGEICSLRKSSLVFDERGVKLFIEKSKSKERYVRLIDSEPYLREYMNKEYSLKGDDDKLPLFYGQRAFFGKELGTSAISEVLQRCAERAEIKKRVWCHLGRHCDITRANKFNLSTEMNAKRHGISAATLRGVYLHLDDKDVDDAYCEVKNGLSREEAEARRDKKEFLTKKRCPRCKQEWGADTKICSCGMVLDRDTAMQIDKVNEVISLIIEKAAELKVDPKTAIDKMFAK